MEYYTTHVVGGTIFLAILLLFSIGNLRWLRELGSYPVLASYPRLTVLIPARNEEKNIERCARTLLEQDYPDFNVVVLDDNSTDKTGEVLECLSREFTGLTIIKGKPKPQGWSGKHWACNQLAKAATGELVLFSDADTTHQPGALRAAVDAMIYEETDVLSIIPKEIVKSTSEKLVVPVMHWAISNFVPVKLVKRAKSDKLCLAIGQSILYRKSAYYAVGGHEAIKSHILDDAPLARLLKRSGYRWSIASGVNHVSCRMYDGWNEVKAGFTRNLFSAFGENTLVFAFVWNFLLLTLVEPIPVLVLYHLGILSFEFEAWLFTIVNIILSFLVWLVPLARFKFPKLAAVVYPVTMIMIYYVAMRSLYATKRGKITWKGRPMETSSQPIQK